MLLPLVHGDLRLAAEVAQLPGRGGPAIPPRHPRFLSSAQDKDEGDAGKEGAPRHVLVQSLSGY